MQRTHHTTNQDDYCGLFANEYVQQRSLPAQSECPTFVMRHRSTSSDHKGAHVSAPSSTALPASSAQRRISEPSSMHRSYPSPSGRSNAKPPIVTKRPSSSSCYKPRSTTSISQLRQQSLPPGVSKSKSTSSTSAGPSTRRSSYSSQRGKAAIARLSGKKLMSSPASLTAPNLMSVGQHAQRWQQSIPSKSSPKQPLLEKRHTAITSQKCVRKGSLQKRQSLCDSASSTDGDIHDGGSNPGSRKTSGSSEVEITQVQFELERLPQVDRRRSSISTVGNSEFRKASLASTTSESSCHRQSSRSCQDRKLRPKRSIEIHIPSPSLSSDSGYKSRRHSDSSKQSTAGVRCFGTAARKHRSPAEGGARETSPCKRKDSSSRVKRITSFCSGASDEDDYYDHGDSEADALSLDLANSLNMEDSESDCFTNDMSFGEYDYINEEDSMSDGGGEWVQEVGGAYKEELTDLDTEDESEDMLMSENDAELKSDSRTCCKQPIRTCVQQQMKRSGQSYRKNFLEVKGAGLSGSQRDAALNNDERCSTGSDASESFKEGGVTESEFVAEVVRRRLRDFGQRESHLDPNLIEVKRGERDRVESKSKVERETNKSLEDKVSDLSHKPAEPATKGGAAAEVVKSHGEVSAISEDVSVSTQRGGEQPPSPALTPSMFPDSLPPTIHFPMPYENYIPLPKEKRVLLKWKMSSITPNVVKNCIARAGFTKCTRGSGWLGYWGRHMKASSFRTIKEYQKINHFPGTFQIGRKDRLWRNLSRLQARVGKRDCDFVPLTFVLPQDLRQLKKQWEEGGPKQKWILKPPAAARGIGIRLAHKWSQIPKKKPLIVQRYLADPFLINGSKFDLRVYVYVSSYDPLVIYVFREGLTRFATCKYSSAMKNLSNRFMHLTNYSINKQNSEFTPNTDETICQGHKWGLLALWRYMKSQLGINTDKVWDSIKDLVIKTIISSESFVSSNVKAFVKNRHSVHELFGFDIMLDRSLKPWVIEVNISPSLHSNSQLDVNIKGRMVRDLFNITGFYLPTKEQITGEEPFVQHTLSTEERLKHSQFMQRNLPKTERKKILNSLTPDDVRMLMLFEDELSRCGHFERVYPSANFDRYRKFFEMEKYYNVLLGEWAAKYEKSPRKGILLLQRLAPPSPAGGHGNTIRGGTGEAAGILKPTQST